ncbi:MAG: hypothetical protein PHV28_04950 [Kiritimatiellae bacterium]|nr:hypothetical protein [Kiritimatiellia bacterium]
MTFLILAVSASLAAARAGVTCDASSVRIDYGVPGFALATNCEKPTKGEVGMGRTDKSRVFVVDAAEYVSAKVVCSVRDDPKLFRTFTVRLTRYNDGGAWTGRAYQGMADARVDFDTAEKRDLGDGRWEVTVPLDCGDLAGIIYKDTWGTFLNDQMPELARRVTDIGNYLDFEVLGETPTFRHPLEDRRMRPDPKRPSAIVVHSATLEKAPAELLPEPVLPGNVFHNDEKPETRVKLTVRRPGAYALEWTIRDAENRVVRTGTEPFASDRLVTLDLAQPSVGWHALDLALVDGARRLMTHHASFALLGRDTRTTGTGEGPYGAWTWGGNHYTTKDLDFVGPLFLKAGFRRAEGIDRISTPENRHRWKLSPPSVMQWGLFRDTTDETRKRVIAKALKDDPNVKTFLIGHESAPNSSYQQAREILGQKFDPNYGLNGWFVPPSQRANPKGKRILPEDRRKIIEQAKHAGAFMRENFPEVKMTVGNSLGCTEFIAELIRNGFKEEYADYMGVETVSRNNLPERQWESSLQAADFMEQTARHFGYDSWKVNASWESHCRLPDLIGADRQAQWYVRDMLLSQCRRYPDIFLGAMMDSGNSYTKSFWGQSGLCIGRPYAYPRKSYVGVATVTKLLDRVVDAKQLETGDPCVYAWEFRRRDGKYVTALWTSRGEVKLAFTGLAEFAAYDFYGRTKDVPRDNGFFSALVSGRRYRVSAGEWASYLMSDEPCLASAAVVARAFPDDLPPADACLLVKAEKAYDWTVCPNKEPLIERTKGVFLPLRTKGGYELRTVVDEERGSCLELELTRPDRTLPLVFGEYAVVELKKPVTIAPNATTLGAWVKGNSGWGQFYWVLELPDGKRTISSGWLGEGPDCFDYGGLLSVDYSGWNYLSVPINDDSPIKNLSTGNVPAYWNRSTLPVGNRKPFKLLGFAFSSQNRPLLLTERRPYSQKIRVAGIFASDFKEQK